jgi:hypothetical protein
MLAVYAVLTVGLLAGRQRGVGGDEACRSAEPVSEHIGSVAALINGAEGVAFFRDEAGREPGNAKKNPERVTLGGRLRLSQVGTVHCYWVGGMGARSRPAA